MYLFICSKTNYLWKFQRYQIFFPLSTIDFMIHCRWEQFITLWLSTAMQADDVRYSGVVCYVPDRGDGWIFKRKVQCNKRLYPVIVLKIMKWGRLVEGTFWSFLNFRRIFDFLKYSCSRNKFDQILWAQQGPDTRLRSWIHTTQGCIFNNITKMVWLFWRFSVYHNVLCEI